MVSRPCLDTTSDRKTTLGLAEGRGPSSPGSEPQTFPPLSTGRQRWQQDVQKLGAPSGTEPYSAQRETPSARPNLFWDHPPRCAVPPESSPRSAPPRPPRPAGPLTSRSPHRPAFPPPQPEQPGLASRSTDYRRHLRVTVTTFQKKLVFKRVTLNNCSSFQVTQNFHKQHDALSCEVGMITLCTGGEPRLRKAR